EARFPKKPPPTPVGSSGLYARWRHSMRLTPWLLLVNLALATAPVRGGEPVYSLRETYSIGRHYHVSCPVTLSGSLTLPAEKGQPAGKSLGVNGASAIDYDERVLSLGSDGEVTKTGRVVRRMDFQRTVGDQPQRNSLRPEVRRLVILRRQQAEVP